MRTCPYCKDSIQPDQYLRHIVDCDGTPQSAQLKFRRRKLVEEKTRAEKEILALKKRIEGIDHMVKEIDDQLPGQLNLSF